MSRSPSKTVGTNDHQDQTAVAVVPSNPFTISHDSEGTQPPAFDAVLKSSRRVAGLTLLVGKEGNGAPVQRMVGTALPWDGVSEDQAYYLNVEPGLPVGTYQFTIADVPDGACWSITAYAKNGSGEQNHSSMYNVNSHTASSNGDGSITVHFGTGDDDSPNYLPITDGWNFVVRLYKAHAEAEQKP